MAQYQILAIREMDRMPGLAVVRGEDGSYLHIGFAEVHDQHSLISITTKGLALTHADRSDSFVIILIED